MFTPFKLKSWGVVLKVNIQFELVQNSILQLTTYLKKAKNEGKQDEESDESTEKSESSEEACIFKKDFYSKAYLSFPHEDKEKEKLDAEKYRKDQRITMYGKGKSKGQFHPIRDFKKLGFEENLLGAVKNFKEPTPIQVRDVLNVIF